LSLALSPATHLRDESAQESAENQRNTRTKENVRVVAAHLRGVTSRGVLDQKVADQVLGLLCNVIPRRIIEVVLMTRRERCHSTIHST
jgi:hypothetical protein